MKKKFVFIASMLLALACVVSLTSCGDDKEDATDNQNPSAQPGGGSDNSGSGSSDSNIYGTWYNMHVEESAEEIEIETFTLNADNTCVWGEYRIGASDNWTAIEKDIDTGVFTLAGNTLTTMDDKHGRQTNYQFVLNNDGTATSTLQKSNGETKTTLWKRFEAGMTPEAYLTQLAAGKKQQSNSASSLVGQWQTTRVVGTERGKSFDMSGDQLRYESMVRLTVNADGTYLMEDQKYQIGVFRKSGSGNWYMLNGVLRLEELGYYSRNGDESVYHQRNEPEIRTYTMISLGATELVIREVDAEEQLDMTITFKRL